MPPPIRPSPLMTILPDGPPVAATERWHLQSEAIDDWASTPHLDLSLQLIEWDGLPYTLTYHPPFPPATPRSA